MNPGSVSYVTYSKIYPGEVGERLLVKVKQPLGEVTFQSLTRYSKTFCNLDIHRMLVTVTYVNNPNEPEPLWRVDVFDRISHEAKGYEFFSGKNKAGAFERAAQIVLENKP